LRHYAPAFVHDPDLSNPLLLHGSFLRADRQTRKNGANGRSTDRPYRSNPRASRPVNRFFPRKSHSPED
jgi:hypothetical protein